MDARRRRLAGFTLIELLVTLAILGIAIVAVGTINYLNQRETLENKQLTELQDDMRQAMETIVPFVRMGSNVGVDTSVPGQYTVTVTIPEGVYVKDKAYTFVFSRKADVLRIDGDQPYCDHIQSLAVELCTDPTDPAKTVPGLYSITIISVDQLPGVQHGLPITMSTKVMMRNHP